MKKAFIFVLTLFLVPFISEAQSLTNLSSNLYHDLENWETQGYIHQLPLLKPYSGITLRALLQEAEKTGTSEVKEKVALYRIQYLGSPSLPKFMFQHDSFSRGTNYGGISQLFLQEKCLVNDFVSFDGQLIGQLIQTNRTSSGSSTRALNSAVVPVGQDVGTDFFVDQTSGSLKGFTVAATASYNSLAGFGNETFNGQFGYTRTSFLDFEGDSLSVSPHAYQAPHFSFSWKTADTTFSSLFLCLTASSWTGDDSKTPGKYMNLSSFQWKPNSVVECVFYDSVIYGQRIAPEYFLPGLKMINAQDAGNGDNIFMGLALRFFLPWDVKLVTDAYLDDFTIMKFLAGSLNTRFKTAFDVNAQWAPKNAPVLDRLSLGYTAVMPYTYTHNPEYVDGNSATEYSNVAKYAGEPNYSDATQMGMPLGTIIGPNSDRLQLKGYFHGPANSQLITGISYIRHGNASEGADLSKYPYLNYVSQGSIFDTGYDTSHTYGNLFETTRFLDQKTIEQHLLVEQCFSIPFEVESLAFTTAVDVAGDWYWNKNIISGNDGFDPYLKLSLTCQF